MCHSPRCLKDLIHTGTATIWSTHRCWTKTFPVSSHPMNTESILKTILHICSNSSFLHTSHHNFSHYYSLTSVLLITDLTLPELKPSVWHPVLPVGQWHIFRNTSHCRGCVTSCFQYGSHCGLFYWEQFTVINHMEMVMLPMQNYSLPLKLLRARS